MLLVGDGDKEAGFSSVLLPSSLVGSVLDGGGVNGDRVADVLDGEDTPLPFLLCRRLLMIFGESDAGSCSGRVRANPCRVPLKDPVPLLARSLFKAFDDG